MNRRALIVLLCSTALAPLPSARAEPVAAASNIAARLVGSWRFVSSVSTRSDGTTFDRWGANPKGTFMFDAGGHFVQVISGKESRFFGAKSFFAFGSYEIDEASKTIIMHTEASSIAGLNGHKQRRIVVALTKDHLKLINPASTSGHQVESVWQREAAAH